MGLCLPTSDILPAIIEVLCHHWFEFASDVGTASLHQLQAADLVQAQTDPSCPNMVAVDVKLPARVNGEKIIHLTDFNEIRQQAINFLFLFSGQCPDGRVTKD